MKSSLTPDLRDWRDSIVVMKKSEWKVPSNLPFTQPGVSHSVHTCNIHKYQAEQGINGRKNGREERREETFLNGNKWKLFKGSSDSYLGHKNTISNFLNFKTLLRSSTI